MQDFKVTFYLRKSRTSKDGLVPIYMRLYFNKEREQIGSIGVSVDPKIWDAKNGRVSGKTREGREINRKLELLTAEYTEIFRRLEFDKSLSIGLIKETYQNGLASTKRQSSVVGFMREYVANVKGKVGTKVVKATYTRYDLCVRLFCQYLKEKRKRADLLFSEVNPDLINGFEKYLREDLSYDNNNTLMKKMRVMKTIFLDAQKAGLLEIDPFKGFRIRYDPTDRGFLTEKEIQALLDLEFKVPRLEKIRDFFVFSCFTGLAYIDVANLSEDNLVELDGRTWIMIKRHKTDVPSNVLLLDVPMHIIEKYKSQRKNGKLLPIPTNQRVNSYLKAIGELAGITKNLTFHLARHTFATLAISKGVPMESVSKMLGHTNLRTTQLYARITNKKVEADMLDFASKIDHFSASI